MKFSQYSFFLSVLAIATATNTNSANTNTPNLRGGVADRELTKAWENDVYFIPVDFNGSPTHELVQFNCTSHLWIENWEKQAEPGRFVISGNQPWTFEGCNLPAGKAKLAVSAGRQAQGGNAYWYNFGTTTENNIGAYFENGHLPDKLNFAMDLYLSFTYSDGNMITVPLRLGQGSTMDPLTGAQVNNWWIGGPGWTVNEVGAVYNYDKLAAGETVSTVAIGWQDYNNQGSNNFNLAYCKDCTMDILQKGNQLAAQEQQSNMEMYFAGKLEEASFDED